jgi:hypothetical protein
LGFKRGDAELVPEPKLHVFKDLNVISQTNNQNLLFFKAKCTEIHRRVCLIFGRANAPLAPNNFKGKTDIQSKVFGFLTVLG